MTNIFGETNPIITGHVTTGGLIVTELDINRGVVTDGNQELVSTDELKDGYLFIGKTGDQPQPAALVSNSNITVTPGPGSLSINTIQDIGTGASPTFQTVNADEIKANTLDISGSIVLTGNLEVDSLQVNNDSSLIGNVAVGGNMTISGLVDGVDISNFKADYDSKVNQDVSTTASPTFVGLTLSAPLATSSTVDGRDVSADGAAMDAHITNVANPHTVTKSQVGLGNVDNESKATMFTSPTFTGTTTAAQIINSGLTATRLAASDASKQLQSVTITNGNGSNTSFAGSTLACSNSQNLSSTGAPTFTNIALSNTTNQIATGTGLNTTTLNFPASAGAVVLTFPNTTQDIVDRTSVQTLTNKTLVGAIVSTSAVSLDDTNSAFELKIQSTSTLTANRTITLDMLNGTRTLQMGGNLSMGSDFSTTGSINLQCASSCIATVPPGTITLADLQSNQSFSGIKTFSTAPVISTISNTGTITLPTSTCTLSGVGLAETFSGQKKFSAVPAPSTTNSVDFGSSSLKWKDMYMTGRINHSGTIKIGDLSGGTDNTSSNMFIGISAGENWVSGTSGTLNTAVGVFAMRGDATTTTDSSTAVGHSALRAVTTGVQNTALGQNALTGLTTASRCVGIGYQSGNSSCGDDSTFIGYRAGLGCAATASCTFVGSSAGRATTATGSFNVAMGHLALGGSVMTSAANNTAIGFSAMRQATSALDNTTLGYLAGATQGSALGITSGSDNILIGSQAGVSSASAVNRIAIGKGVLNSTNNTTIIGNASCITVTLNGNVMSDADNTRTLGSAVNRWSAAYGYVGDFDTSMSTQQHIMNSSVSATASPCQIWNAMTYRKFVVTRTLTSAEIKSINTTPIAILNAQGAGISIFVLAVNVKFSYGSVAYAGAGSVGLLQGTLGMNWGGIIPNSIMTGTSSNLMTYMSPQFSVNGTTNSSNKPLNIVGSTNFTLGDSTMTWIVECYAVSY